MSITTNGLRVIFGGAAFNSAYGSTPESVSETLQFLLREGTRNIDSGQAYGYSENLLGQDKVSYTGFEVDTKVAGGLWPHVRHTKETVIQAGEPSIKALGADQLDVYYIHAPDQTVTLKDSLDGINELHKMGKFKRFGLSNFRLDEVLEVIRIAKRMPLSCLGNYNAIGRVAEKELFPVLREHNISFYAYSPIAGGFLTKTKKDITDGKGRFNKDLPFFGEMYNTLYNTPAKLEFLMEFGNIAISEGISQAELAYRWVTYHSCLKAQNGDGIIIGSRYGTQLTNTLAWLKKGPLSVETALKVNDLSKIIEREGILDNWNDFISKQL
ncbi:hypothetical protein N7462_010495 [Penicillium macrosclerotiorum]|uniref:uncharacterized protein n=1 Tax=Penicillium macrosclerotiorum TaxID=303699 RepID=UPI00254905D7|nr:uncharacterized protein N7462_010495 [Penicillium macrosclerotiorum]KAJ5669425.1 hypothetical protein N7462_010495 [Penicillium macrosclerotiorum]